MKEAVGDLGPRPGRTELALGYPLGNSSARDRVEEAHVQPPPSRSIPRWKPRVSGQASQTPSVSRIALTI